MQKLIITLLIITLFAACRKNHEVPAAPVHPIVGKWNIYTVTVIPFDSTGSAINSGATYAEPLYYYFQFNTNTTWKENLSPDPNSGIGENGNYVLHGDTSFTLINSNAPAKAIECTIDTLTSATFVFTYRRSTLYNGITPGFLKYIFHLKK